MQYGFVIDNRKCIGCHACTTACKSEHQVPIGVNRTWVKQVEKGTFPDARRFFSVLRCNHCSDAPCVEICPVEALYTREDGIVDFDKERCIGCKSCMQACPYDALYIDPQTHTAAKCNYCAHRIDVGLEPACVIVCPENAIISGDTTDPNSKISHLLAEHEVKARKVEKSTNPNLFYIDADESSLNPNLTEKSDEYFWSSQSRGVGHFAKYAEKIAYSNTDVVEAIRVMSDPKIENGNKEHQVVKSIDILTNKPRRVYDAPDKGLLWGWEVSSYLWTKAIAAGIIMVLGLLWVTGDLNLSEDWTLWASGFSLFFLMATGILLVLDLDQPKRFLYVLLRPQWRSWLVRGAYFITAFGGIVSVFLLSQVLNWGVMNVFLMIALPFAVLTAIYTAYLFAQAKGRDFWQSKTLPFHMLIHSLVAGASLVLLLDLGFDLGQHMEISKNILLIAIAVNVLFLLVDIFAKPKSEDGKTVHDMIIKKDYSHSFWFGVMLTGNILPLLFLLMNSSDFWPVAAVLALIGTYITQKIWVEAPQKISLS